MASTLPWRAGANSEAQMDLPLGAVLRRRRVDAGYWLYCALHTAGFVVVTLLMSWGVFVLFFLAISNFSIDMMMNQLDNLTSRYIAADAGRVAQFKTILACVHLAISAAIIFFRRHALLPRDAKHGSTTDD